MWDGHVLFFTGGIDGVVRRQLINQRDETLGSLHVAAVWFAQSSNQGLFFNVDAPQCNSAIGHKNDQEGRPIRETQGEAEHGQQATSVAGMANEPIRTGINYPMIGRDGDVCRKKTPEINDRIPAQQQTRHKQAAADIKTDFPQMDSARGQPVGGHNTQGASRRVHQPD